VVQAHLTRVLAIVGPTGGGKTALALAVAERLGAEIVNADSRQVYRGLDIGSAKPTAAERARVPHHLFDVVDPDRAFDCAQYAALARATLAEIGSRGRPAILAGGTGLYLKALRHGLFAGPARDAALRARLEALEREAPGALHARLREIDPIAADRLHPNDAVRLIRALEVYERTGKPISAWQREHAFRRTEVEFRTIGLDRERGALYGRIDRRCREMIEAGLVEEVRELRRRYGKDAPGLRSIGYREIGAFLDGARDLAQALSDMARATRRLAKRQLTWFRADSTIAWLDAATAGAAQVVAIATALGYPDGSEEAPDADHRRGRDL
jgi:tRNA dimethylallyltransferase